MSRFIAPGRLRAIVMGWIFVALALPARAQEGRFDQEIAPLLAERCLECHRGPMPKGMLDLTHRASAFRGGKSGPALIPKNLAESVLWQRVQNDEMPPKKPLPEPEKRLLKAWIEAGAAWGTDPIDPFRVTTTRRAGYDWWSLRPVQRPALPTVQNKDWPLTPIDHFLLARLEAEGLQPSPPADPRALIRRLSFDLTGLPPTPEEVAAFVKEWHGSATIPGREEPARQQAVLEQLVDRLLASPHYGERWARHWLDVVRYGESHGFEHDELRKNAWRYRDWVIQAFNRDLPYDAFARLQIAGDVLQPQEPDGIIATGFLVAGGYDSVGQGQSSLAMKAAVRQDELEDIVGTLSQTFLGLTAQCARCHDHKFDPVRQKEYYRLTAAVAGVRHGERDIRTLPMLQASARQQAELQRKLAALQQELDALEQPIRTRILAERRKGDGTTDGKAPAPIPGALARWDFTRSLLDEVSGLEAQLHGQAAWKTDGLHLPGGKSYASSPPLPRPVQAKTLTALVRLRDLTQRGGAALSLQSLNGQLFDAIVFGEREPGRWLPGSDGFCRTQDLGAAAETGAQDRPVHVAISYQSDGTITVYRNGVVHGKSYQASEVLKFGAGKAMLLFGLRHEPPGANKHLAGTLLRAEVYDRALSAQEVAASAGVAHEFVAEAEITVRLGEAALERRAQAKRAIEAVRAQLAERLGAPQKALAYAVVPRAPEPTYLLLRGNSTQPGPVVTPGGVAALGPTADFGLEADSSDADRRRMLAAWISAGQNPLFARVMVNRLWHYHFGVGLVETPSDFGFNGARPSHPQLLDWLAREFMTPSPLPGEGKVRPWSMKHMHRLIVLSAAYRQGSRFRPEAARRDAGNRWLWRKSPLRLEAEAVRDSILSVAGQLNRAQGGPGYQDFDITIRGATYTYTPLDADEPARYRRSVYRTWARSGRNGLLDALDCPDPSTVTPRRALTTTPLQALALMNNALLLRMSDRLAERLQREAGTDQTRQIARAYELAYGRPPTPEELARARPVVESHGLPILCRALFNSNEFMYVD